MSAAADPDLIRDAAARRVFLRRMLVPLASFAALLALLGCIVLLGALAPSSAASWIEIGLTVCMALIVLLASMEVTTEPPLMRLFAGLGFVWVAILFGMTLLDYLSR